MDGTSNNVFNYGNQANFGMFLGNASSNSKHTMQQHGYTTDLTNLDVLLGRGSGPNVHEGNIRFRNHVAHRKEEYTNSKNRNNKSKIAREVALWVFQNGGKFVKKLELEEARDVGLISLSEYERYTTNSNTKDIDNIPLSYYELVDDETIMEKAKQSLRQLEKRVPRGLNRDDDESFESSFRSSVHSSSVSQSKPDVITTTVTSSGGRFVPPEQINITDEDDRHRRATAPASMRSDVTGLRWFTNSVVTEGEEDEEGDDNVGDVLLSSSALHSGGNSKEMLDRGVGGRRYTVANTELTAAAAAASSIVGATSDHYATSDVNSATKYEVDSTPVFFSSSAGHEYGGQSNLNEQGNNNHGAQILQQQLEQQQRQHVERQQRQMLEQQQRQQQQQQQQLQLHQQQLQQQQGIQFTPNSFPQQVQQQPPQNTSSLPQLPASWPNCSEEEIAEYAQRLAQFRALLQQQPDQQPSSQLQVPDEQPPQEYQHPQQLLDGDPNVQSEVDRLRLSIDMLQYSLGITNQSPSQQEQQQGRQEGQMPRLEASDTVFPQQQQQQHFQQGLELTPSCENPDKSAEYHQNLSRHTGSQEQPILSPTIASDEMHPYARNRRKPPQHKDQQHKDQLYVPYQTQGILPSSPGAVKNHTSLDSKSELQQLPPLDETEQDNNDDMLAYVQGLDPEQMQMLRQYGTMDGMRGADQNQHVFTFSRGAMGGTRRGSMTSRTSRRGSTTSRRGSMSSRRGSMQSITMEDIGTESKRRPSMNNSDILLDDLMDSFSYMSTDGNNHRYNNQRERIEQHRRMSLYTNETIGTIDDLENDDEMSYGTLESNILSLPDVLEHEPTNFWPMLGMESKGGNAMFSSQRPPPEIHTVDVIVDSHRSDSGETSLNDPDVFKDDKAGAAEPKRGDSLDSFDNDGLNDEYNNR